MLQRLRDNFIQALSPRGSTERTTSLQGQEFDRIGVVEEPSNKTHESILLSEVRTESSHHRVIVTDSGSSEESEHPRYQAPKHLTTIGQELAEGETVQIDDDEQQSS